MKQEMETAKTPATNPDEPTWIQTRWIDRMNLSDLPKQIRDYFYEEDEPEEETFDEDEEGDPYAAYTAPTPKSDEDEFEPMYPIVRPKEGVLLETMPFVIRALPFGTRMVSTDNTIEIFRLTTPDNARYTFTVMTDDSDITHVYNLRRWR